jgi:hypothetical protein
MYIMQQNRDDILDVNSFTEDDLMSIMGLSSPSDRELEAKIIFYIEKYRNIPDEESRKLAFFFENVYARFFGEEEEEVVGDEELGDVVEGFTTTMPDSTAATAATTSIVTTAAANNTADAGIGGGSNDKVISTKVVEVKLDNQNPLLKQTIKRIITVDSAYRHDKTASATDFTFLLSESIRNVVSLKLYSVNIPYTWYTISNNFGCNFFYIKGLTDGINDGLHDYKVSVSPGNYITNDLINAVNTSLKNLNQTYTDVSFGTSSITYNSFTALSSMTIDITKQYSETSFYLKFNTSNWVYPTSSTALLTSREYSIPSFLGFDTNNYYPFNAYYPYKIKSNAFNYNENNYSNIRSYNLSATNNYFTVIKYIGPSAYSSSSVVDISFNIYFSLAINNNYSISELVTDINTQITKNTLLNSTDSYINLVTTDISSAYAGLSYHELSLKTNRNTTQNIPYSKLAVSFPHETSTYTIWTGKKSAFQMKSNTQEINIIRSDLPPIPSSNYYIITTNPYVDFSCSKKYFTTSSNKYTFTVANNYTGYGNINNYITEINTAITNTNTQTITTENPNGLFYIPYSKSFLDSSSVFNFQLDYSKEIDQTNFVMNLTGTFLNTQMNFSNASTYDLSYNNVFSSSFTYSTTYNVAAGQPVLFLLANSNWPSSISVTNDISYVVTFVENASISYSNLADYLTELFVNYMDADGDNIFKNSTITTTLVQSTVTAVLTVNYSKFITQKDYSVQFSDIKTITQNNFYIDNTSGSFMSQFGLNNTTRDLVNSNFLLYSSLDNNYTLEGNFIFTLKPSVITDALDVSSLYSYVITPPSATYSKTEIATMQQDINSQINLFPDLSGTQILFSIDSTGTILNTEVNIVINQKYTLDISNSSWYNTLYVDSTMIRSPFKLNNVDSSFSVIAPSYSGIKGYNSIKSNETIKISSLNNTFQLVPYENGVSSTSNSNLITISIPFDKDSGTSLYTLDELLTEINTLFSNNPVLSNSKMVSLVNESNQQYISVQLTANRVYGAKDYYISFYNTYDFIKCSNNGDSTIAAITWDTTMGWMLGYRVSPTYILSDYYDANTGGSYVQISSNTCINTYLYNYFMICLDDYNLNRLNDGVITITKPNTVVSLPSYVNRTNYVCDPATGNITYNTSVKDGYNSLTNNQLYSLTELINSSNGSTNTNGAYSATPFAKDVFGIIPLKLNGLNTSQTFAELGGSLQNQERSYFGPVNIYKMSVKLLSDKGTLIDLNGQDWSFSLICEQIYKKESSSSK